MANSDNVLRGGLTPKHVDVPELLRVLDFAPQPPPVLHRAADGGWVRYDTRAAEFLLRRFEGGAGGRPVAGARRRPADPAVHGGLGACVRGGEYRSASWVDAARRCGWRPPTATSPSRRRRAGTQLFLRR